MKFPEGSEFLIADTAAADAAFIAVVGFDDIGDIGLDKAMTDQTVLSDKSTKFGVSDRKEGREQDLTFRYEEGDDGQAKVIAACKAGERRKCQIKLPSGSVAWEFTALFGSYKLPKPEAGKAWFLTAKIGIEEETSEATI